MQKTALQQMYVHGIGGDACNALGTMYKTLVFVDFYGKPIVFSIYTLKKGCILYFRHSYDCSIVLQLNKLFDNTDVG